MGSAQSRGSEHGTGVQNSKSVCKGWGGGTVFGEAGRWPPHRVFFLPVLVSCWVFCPLLFLFFWRGGSRSRLHPQPSHPSSTLYIYIYIYIAAQLWGNPCTVHTHYMRLLDGTSPASMLLPLSNAAKMTPGPPAQQQTVRASKWIYHDPNAALAPKITTIRSQ